LYLRSLLGSSDRYFGTWEFDTQHGSRLTKSDPEWTGEASIADYEIDSNNEIDPRVTGIARWLRELIHLFGDPVTKHFGCQAHRYRKLYGAISNANISRVVWNSPRRGN
jgi:hypothetical protein